MSLQFLVKILFPPASGSRNAVMRLAGNTQFSTTSVYDGTVDHEANLFYAVSQIGNGVTLLPVDLNSGLVRGRSLVAPTFWGGIGIVLGGN